MIEDYLRNWEFAIPVRTLQSPSAEDLQTFGLDTPKAEVTFEMGRSKVRVSLGTGSPVDGGGYVRIDDGPEVSVVGDDVVALFGRTASAFEIKDDAGAPDLSDASRRQKKTRRSRRCALTLTTSLRPWPASRAMRTRASRCSC